MTAIDTHIHAHTGDRALVSLRVLARVALDGAGAIMIRCLDWQEQARQRRQLLALSDRALRDFGASRADADAEGGKPFWRS